MCRYNQNPNKINNKINKKVELHGVIKTLNFKWQNKLYHTKKTSCITENPMNPFLE